MRLGHKWALGAIAASSLPCFASVAVAQSIPPGYVHIPGGWTHPSCVHEIPNGATVDADKGDVSMNGQVIAHYNACSHPPIPTVISSATSTPSAPPTSTGSGNGPTSFGGWQEDTLQFAPSGQVFNWVQENIQVPPAPTQATPQTLYYFPGLQSTDANCGIIQPVLQWGVSPAGGGSFWSVGSWWWSLPGQYHSPLARVSAGDVLTGYIFTSSSCGSPSPPYGCNNYQVEMYDNTSGTAYETITASSYCRFNVGFPAVFEVDSGHPVTTCNQLPNAWGVDFYNISLWTGPSAAAQSQYNSTAYSPYDQFGTGPCGAYAITDGSNYSFLWN